MIYIPKVVDSRNDFWTSLIQGVQMSAQEANVDIEIMAPEEENDVEGQNRILKQAILKNPDAILISPSSFTESNSLLQEARDQGIRITFIDSYTEESIQEITVATDNVEAGKTWGICGFSAETGGSDRHCCPCKRRFYCCGKRKGFREGLGKFEKTL